MHRITSASAFLVPLILFVATAAFSNGCGDSGAGLDNTDAGDAATTNDASTVPDGGPGVDQDQDGYPADQDCDDNDDTIYPGTERACQTDCDYGIQICLADGTWLDCTAPTDCDCTLPGETRQVDCGNCGTATQECGLDLMWEFPGDCSNEGECTPGEEGQDTCQFCGTGLKTCGNECTWGSPDCFGVCAPGATQGGLGTCPNPWEVNEQICDTQCTWDIATSCTAACLLTPRTGTTDFKDEICVLAGPFVMGSNPGQFYPEEEPEHVVNLTPYFIDVYEVTVARYRECVIAGVCTAPDSQSYYWFPDSDDRAVESVTYQQAVTFCLWDGGRFLPTEAQWEKAARGPSPSEIIHAWGNGPATCDRIPAFECLPSGEHRPTAVDAHPLGVSVYGAHHMGGNVREWCRDYFDGAYYQTSPALDPTGPSAGTDRVIRGIHHMVQQQYFDHTVSLRVGHSPADFTNYIGFRCSRPGF